MSINTLVTDVHGQDYIVLQAADGIVFAPCVYDHVTDIAQYCPAEATMLHTFENLSPLEQHETKIRKLIAVNRRLMVKNGIARENNYQTN